MVRRLARACGRCKRVHGIGQGCPYAPKPRVRNHGDLGYVSGWQAVSRAVLKRDNYICWLCGRPGANTADHVIPRSRGGATLDMNNLKAAHGVCNSRKGTRIL